MSKQRTITLTNRPPVKINEDDWPIIARSDDSWHDGQVRCQANREHSRTLVVRRHNDGRAIVYGVDTYDTRWQDEVSYAVRRGVLLASGDDIIGAITEVAADLEEAFFAAGHATGRLYPWPELTQQCISDLPAEEI